MRINSLDHLVLTVRNEAAALAFYTDILGMIPERMQNGRACVHFGDQKINLQVIGVNLDPNALHATPGSADLCFLVNGSMEDLQAHLKAHRQTVIDGPVRRTGSNGPILSVYIRDPDENLIELSVPAD